MNEVYNTDCLEYMRTLPDKAFQLAIADPPYGIGADKPAVKPCKVRQRNGSYLLIKELDRIEPTDDFDFKREDYLGVHANDKSESDYWSKRRRNAEKEASLLNTIARTHFFNVAGQTINLDEVVRIMWHEKEEATLVMRDGTKVKTYTEAEYAVVVDMYGSNRSDRHMTKPYGND